MYLNATRCQVRPDVDVRELMRRSYPEVTPLLRQLAGLRSYYDTQVADDAFLSITVWDSQADCEKGLQQLGPWVAQNLGPLLAGAPQREGGEVIGHSDEG